MKKLNKTSLATFIGAAVVSSFAGTVNAESNPFAMNEMASGYMQVAAADAKTATPVAPAAKTAPSTAVKPAGSCAEGKCGAGMMNNAAAPADKAAEAKCGEKKCGAMMENSKMKAGMEAMCGAMMKGKEGSCGDMMKSMEASCGGMMKGKEGACGDMMKHGAMPAAPAASATPVKAAEGKCGEKKCGAMMENGKMKPGMEASCGAMMKGKEGSCGEVVKPTAPITKAAPAKPVAVAPVAKPVAAVPVAKPAAPAPAAKVDTTNKVVEGQCAAVKEVSHTATKYNDDKHSEARWGNRKKVVNP